MPLTVDVSLQRIRQFTKLVRIVSIFLAIQRTASNSHRSTQVARTRSQLRCCVSQVSTSRNRWRCLPAVLDQLQSVNVLSEQSTSWKHDAARLT